MNNATETLVNICVLIAAVWGAGKAAMSLYSGYYQLTSLPATVAQDQGETDRQLRAIWKKLDHLDTQTDARLDRIERQLNYVAGAIHVQIGNSEGQND